MTFIGHSFRTKGGTREDPSPTPEGDMEVGRERRWGDAQVKEGKERGLSSLVNVELYLCNLLR